MTALKVNQSVDQRMARIAMSIFMIAAGIALAGIWGLVLGICGLVPLVCGLLGWCPLTALYKIKLQMDSRIRHSESDLKDNPFKPYLPLAQYLECTGIPSSFPTKEGEMAHNHSSVD